MYIVNTFVYTMNDRFFYKLQTCKTFFFFSPKKSQMEYCFTLSHNQLTLWWISQSIKNIFFHSYEKISFTYLWGHQILTFIVLGRKRENVKRIRTTIIYLYVYKLSTVLKYFRSRCNVNKTKIRVDVWFAVITILKNVICKLV